MNPLIISVARADRVATGKGDYRVLIERRWPSGLSKRRLPIDAWLKDAAPSPGLCEWFERTPEQWDWFRDRYYRELESKPRILEELYTLVRKQPVKLVFGSANEFRNNAVALREFLFLKLSPSSPSASTSGALLFEKAS